MVVAPMCVCARARMRMCVRVCARVQSGSSTPEAHEHLEVAGRRVTPGT